MLLSRSHHDAWFTSRRRPYGSVLSPLRGRNVRLHPSPSFVNKLSYAVVQPQQLCLLRRTATGPPNAASVIQQIDIANPAIHHPNGLPYPLVYTPAHEKVLLVLLLGHLPSHPPHKHAHQPCLGHIIFQIDVHRLNEPTLNLLRTLERLVEIRILILSRK